MAATGNTIDPFLEALLSVYGRTRFIVSTSLTEEISDNFEQDSSKEGIDARTMVVLGTVYRLDDGQNFVSLANTANAFYQAGSGESRVGYADLVLNAGYRLPPLSFGLTESFSRDDNTGLDTTTPLLGPSKDSSAIASVPRCGTISRPSLRQRSAIRIPW